MACLPSVVHMDVSDLFGMQLLGLLYSEMGIIMKWRRELYKQKIVATKKGQSCSAVSAATFEASAASLLAFNQSGFLRS